MFATLPAVPTLDEVETSVTTTVTRCVNAGTDNAKVVLTRHVRNPHRMLVHCTACSETWTTTVLP